MFGLGINLITPCLIVGDKTELLMHKEKKITNCKLALLLIAYRMYVQPEVHVTVSVIRLVKKVLLWKYLLLSRQKPFFKIIIIFFLPFFERKMLPAPLLYD